jgi:hypothetical protein
MLWGQLTMVGHYEGYCNNCIGVLCKTPWVDSFWPTLSKEYCLRQNVILTIFLGIVLHNLTIFPFKY